MIAAPANELWEMICDPHHLPRWWPRVMRVEDVEDDAFTEVMRTAKGKTVRADFRLLERDAQARSLIWEQQLEGTPFARVLKEARTRVSLQEADGGTRVTIELEQKLSGFFPRFGGFMLRRAAATTLDEALDGLERIGG
jgi:carbon monoxide dehydrogenase subunit G